MYLQYIKHIKVKTKNSASNIREDITIFEISPKRNLTKDLQYLKKVVCDK